MLLYVYCSMRAAYLRREKKSWISQQCCPPPDVQYFYLCSRVLNRIFGGKRDVHLSTVQWPLHGYLNTKNLSIYPIHSFFLLFSYFVRSPWVLRWERVLIPATAVAPLVFFCFFSYAPKDLFSSSAVRFVNSSVWYPLPLFRHYGHGEFSRSKKSFVANNRNDLTFTNPVCCSWLSCFCIKKKERNWNIFSLFFFF